VPVSRAWVTWRDFEIEREKTGERFGLYTQKKDLAVIAKYPKRLGFSAQLLGEKGGRKKSDAKASAARANGALGGRPKDAKPHNVAAASL